jgi:Rab5 GDP/GTP exchange factor
LQGGAIDFIERLDRTSLTISDEEFEKNVEESVSAIAERHPPTAQSHQLPEPASIKAEGTSPRASLDVPHRSKSVRSEGKSDSENEENAAVAGLLRTIQRPLSTIGRIFSDDNATTPQVPLNQPPLTPQPLTQHRRSPLARGTLAASPSKGTDVVQAQMSAEDAAARQASKEAEDARTIRAREERSVVETLCGMFPALDREVVVDVVRANEGR